MNAHCQRLGVAVVFVLLLLLWWLLLFFVEKKQRYAVTSNGLHLKNGFEYFIRL